MGLLRLLVRDVRPHRRRVAVLAVLLLMALGLALVAPQVLARVVDDLTERRSGVASGLALYAGLALLTFLVTTAEAVVAEDVAWRGRNALRSDLLRHALVASTT